MMRFATLVKNTCIKYGIPDAYREYILANDYMLEMESQRVFDELVVVAFATAYYDCDFLNKNTDSKEQLIYQIITNDEILIEAKSRYRKSNPGKRMINYVMTKLGIDKKKQKQIENDVEYWDRLCQIVTDQSRRLTEPERRKKYTQAERTADHIRRKRKWQKRAMPLGYSIVRVKGFRV